MIKIGENTSPEIKSFLEHVVYERTYYHVDGEIEDGKLPDYSVTRYRMSSKEVIENFRGVLTEDEIKRLQDYEK